MMCCQQNVKFGPGEKLGAGMILRVLNVVRRLMVTGIASNRDTRLAAVRLSTSKFEFAKHLCNLQ
jgi:hypothetical protein